MAFYCLNMLNMALELAKHNPTYEDIASKFFEHFLFISDAMTFRSGDASSVSLWNDEDGFYYDAIQWDHGHTQQLPVRSLVGLIPLYATLTLEPSLIKKFTGFKKRMDWFIENRTDISGRNIANMKGRFGRRRTEDADWMLTRMHALSPFHALIPFQPRVRATESCLRWPAKTVCARFCTGCWMRRSS